MAYTIKIASAAQHIYDVECFLNTIFKELKFSRKIYCKIYLAVTEAVNNAIVHGNKKDRSKFVSITFNETDEQFILQVEDEGKGFNYLNIPDPRLPDNIKKESGRGIFIMKQYADEITFNNAGNTVKLIFNK